MVDGARRRHDMLVAQAARLPKADETEIIEVVVE
jgi:hypothetical protein